MLISRTGRQRRDPWLATLISVNTLRDCVSYVSSEGRFWEMRHPLVYHCEAREGVGKCRSYPDLVSPTVCLLSYQPPSYQLSWLQRLLCLLRLDAALRWLPCSPVADSTARGVVMGSAHTSHGPVQACGACRGIGTGDVFHVPAWRQRLCLRAILKNARSAHTTPHLAGVFPRSAERRGARTGAPHPFVLRLSKHCCGTTSSCQGSAGWSNRMNDSLLSATATLPSSPSPAHTPAFKVTRAVAAFPKCRSLTSDTRTPRPTSPNWVHPLLGASTGTVLDVNLCFVMLVVAV